MVRQLMLTVLLLVCAPTFVHAQPLPIDKLTPPLTSEKGQSFMRGMSWATLTGAITLTTWEAAHATDKKKALLLEGTGLAATGLSSLAVKALAHRARPCAPADCGVEDPYKSFWSGHAAIACFSIPVTSGKGAAITGSLLAAGTILGRILGNRHFLTDTVAGCAGGTMWRLLMNRLLLT